MSIKIANNKLFLRVLPFSLLAWFLAVPIRTLNFGRLDWLQTNDPATHYLGWAFFRLEPLFQFPFGKTSFYGNGYNSSFFMTDSIPLVGVPLKFLSNLLPQHFQYLGIWILLCFILQAYYGTRLVCHFVVNKTSQFLVSLLIIFSPIFYYRLVHQDQGHIQLTSHFLILAAFVYYLELEPDNHKWIFLVPASFLIQTYIALMILVIFLASYANVYWKNWKQVDLSVAMRFLRVPIVTLIVLYTVGFFATSQNAMAAGGYGIYKTDLLGLIDPKTNISAKSISFSWFFPDFNTSVGTDEGFSYLGFGVIVLVCIAVAILIKSRFAGIKISRSTSILFLATLLLAIFSLSNIVEFAGNRLFTFGMPEKAFNTFSYFRCSGRFIWPMVYLVVLISAKVVESKIKSTTLLCGIFALCVVVQITEILPSLSRVRDRYEKVEQTQVLASRFDDVNAIDTFKLKQDLLQLSSKCIKVLPGGMSYGWIDISFIAYEIGATTNQGYFSRLDESRFSKTEESTERDFLNSNLTKNCTYIVTPEFKKSHSFEIENVKAKSRLTIGRLQLFSNAAYSK